MFSTGQWIFAGIFFLVFVAIIIFSYRKDLKIHRKYYKGSLYVLLGFIFFVVLLFLVKFYLTDRTN